MKNLNITAAKLKVTAMVTMVLFNIAMFDIVKIPWLKYACGIIGASSLTLFAFLISEGVKHTRSTNKYVIRTLIFAIISAFPFHAITKMLNGGQGSITGYYSAALSAFLCVGALVTYDRMKSRGFRIALILFLVVISYFIRFYGAPYVFILTFIIHICKDNFRKMAYYITALYGALFAVGLVFKLAVPDYSGSNELTLMIYQVGCILPLPLIKAYNGEEGVKLKWIAYAFYPLMLIVFMLVIQGSFDFQTLIP